MALVTQVAPGQAKAMQGTPKANKGARGKAPAMSYSAQTTPMNARRNELNFHNQRGLLGPQQEHCRGKKTLLLDLDETLVHSQFKQVKKSDYVLPVDIEGRICNIFVLKRPGTDYFLQ